MSRNVPPPFDAALACASRDRRRLLLDAARAEGGPKDGAGPPNGIDEIEVDPSDQRTLFVTFFGPVPKGLTEAHVRIEGGRRITGIRALSARAEAAPRAGRDPRLAVRLHRAGDFSTYRFRLVAPEGGGAPRPHPALDPRHAALDFSFKADCATGLDCAPAERPPEPPGDAPAINYLAKDYQGFRQLMLDRMALTVPAWRERHVPDLGITLVELLAFHADRLSYLQDAIAAEAYLETARRRSSVRRHLRLVDYRLHEGCNARAFVSVQVGAPLRLEARQIAFVAGAEPSGFPDGTPIPLRALPPPEATEAGIVWFEPVAADPGAALEFRPETNRIHFWTWGETECCLPRGATGATLRIDAKRPKPGDILILAEVQGPRGGGEPLDPTRSHPVRLVRVERVTDPLFPREKLAGVEWGEADALPFDLCLAARLDRPPCGPVGDLAVAFGNVVLVDHGRTREQALEPPGEGEVGTCVCDREVVERRLVGRWRPALAAGPVTHAAPVDHGAASAAALLLQDPHEAVPALSVVEEGDDGAAVFVWEARFDLLASGPEDRHLVLEPDVPTRLRFGDGAHGMAPEAGRRWRARHRTGNGTAGNVGADAIVRLVVTDPALVVAGVDVRPTNHLPAICGTEPEPLERARLEGPMARRQRRVRAIIADDYAAIAAEERGVQGAAARLAWTGSWHAVETALDPEGGEALPPALREQIERRLERARRIGHDLEVEPAVYVPLDLRLTVCAAPGAVAGAVAAAVREALGSGPRGGGEPPGFFHPDRLRLGAPVRTSAIVAEVMALPRVVACRVDHLARLGAPAPQVPSDGRLAFGPKEVAQLADDPSRPELGRLRVEVGGGR